MPITVSDSPVANESSSHEPSRSADSPSSPLPPPTKSPSPPAFAPLPPCSGKPKIDLHWSLCSTNRPHPDKKLFPPASQPKSPAQASELSLRPLWALPQPKTAFPNQNPPSTQKTVSIESLSDSPTSDAPNHIPPRFSSLPQSLQNVPRFAPKSPGSPPESPASHATDRQKPPLLPPAHLSPFARLFSKADPDMPSPPSLPKRQFLERSLPHPNHLVSIKDSAPHP